MGKHTYVEQHDYLRLLCKFPDGSSFDVNLGRYGANHSASPNDALADRISAAFENARNAKSARYDGYGDYLKRAGVLADKAASREDFLAALTEHFQVGDRPAEAATGKPRATALGAKRPTLDVVLPSGEAFSLTLNDRSESLKQWPTLLTRYTRIMQAAKGLDSVSPSRADALGRMAEIARSSSDLAEWEARVVEATRALAAAAAPVAERALSGTKVVVTKKRSWEIVADFPNGDHAALTISAKSAASALRPYHRGMDAAFGKAILDAKAAGIADDEALANALCEAASRTVSIAECAEAIPEFVAAAQAKAGARP